MATNYIPEVMTTAVRDAIVDPRFGLIISNSDTNKLNFFDATSWVELGGGGMWTSIEKQTIVSAVSSVDFETGLTGKDAFKLVGTNIELDTTASIRIRVKAAGVYQTGGADYEYAHHVIGAGGGSTEQNANAASGSV